MHSIQTDSDKQNIIKPEFKHGFTFTDLFDTHRLKELTEIFYLYYEKADPEQFNKFASYRDAKGEGFDEVETSKILINSGRHLEDFLGDFFNITDELEKLKRNVNQEKVILSVKRDFIQRKVFKNLKEKDLVNLNFAAFDEKVSKIKQVLFSGLDWIGDEERSTALLIEELEILEGNYKSYYEQRPVGFQIPADIKNKFTYVIKLLDESGLVNVYNKEINLGECKAAGFSEEDRIDYIIIKNIINEIQKWCFARYYDTKAKEKIKDWVLYKFPLDIDYNDLVYNKCIDNKIPQLIHGKEETFRRRDGFKLTDERYNNREVMSEVEYCVFCHERKKDSCSKGLKEKDGSLKRNPLGIKLEGCPLDEKISEMHLLKDEGSSVAALSLIMIDNPMCPGTGHRICNDCMKACIYQRQEPVNIPQIETRVLTEVLELTWGFEIYSLLTRWNPLNVNRPYELPYNGKKVLVVGVGPAGYTLSQHLLNEGFGVIGIDGLKIEPIHKNLTGYFDTDGKYIQPEPLKYFREVKDNLDERIFLGFGGVSEYGITVRWDKNFLKVIYLTLARRKYFRFYDGVRFGGTIEINDAWEMGFDHIAIATGAGKPTLLKVKNNLIRGFRMASDFLMALQLTGAAKKDSIANLMIQLPAVVIGGGLTAIDTATETAAYYPVQAEKFLDRFEVIVKEFGEKAFWSMFDEEEKIIANKFIGHGKLVKAERERAKKTGEKPNFVPLVKQWGGVTIAYRKSITDSPAYRLNHEEIIKSLEEGIYFWEKLSPEEAITDEYGAVKELIFRKQDKDSSSKWIELDEKLTLPAKSVLVAAGTSPNVIYEREHPGTFELDEWKQFFQTFKLKDAADGFELEKTPKGETGFFTSYNQEGKFITVYGDNHPVYAGNVVKAMASARDGYKQIIRLFNKEISANLSGVNDDGFFKLTKYLDENLFATVEQVNTLTPSIIEVIVKAPLQARKFQPGQFYRLQNYEVNSRKVNGTTLMMEGLALTGAWVDVEKGLLSLIVLEMWGSSRLCRSLKIGERVVVMGPTGSPTEIPTGETVLLAGGGLGNAVLFSIARALKHNGNKVIYFAGYKNSGDLFKQNDVEEGTDQVIWSNDIGEPIKPRRPQDRTITANIVQAMLAYAKGELEIGGNKPLFDLSQVDRIIAIGSDKMMNAVKVARFGVLKDYLKPKHTAIGSINSTMQCMMKEVCAQCLQRHVDPVTGKEYFVFSCFNQDQQLDAVDFNNLSSRLKNNSVLEKQTKFWLDHLLTKLH